MENTPGVNVTEEHLSLLPIRQVAVSGVPCSVRYDAAAGRIYLLDKDGNWTGKSGNYQFNETQEATSELPSVPSEPAQPAEEDIRQPEKDEEDDKADDSETEDDDDYDEGGGILGKKNVLLVVAAILVVIVAILYCLSDVIWPAKEDEEEVKEIKSSTTVSAEESQEEAGDADPDSEVTEESDGTVPEEETTQTEPAETTYQVLTTASALLPGDELTAEVLSSVSLSEDEYRRVCTEANVFTEQDIARLIGMECAAYTPAGQYLQYDDVVSEFTVTNPWGRSSDRQAVVTLPVSCTAENMASLLWGRYVDLEITVETTVAVPQTQPATAPSGEGATQETQPPAETTPGVQHYSATVESTVVETYTVQAAAICDVLDAEGNSLFMDFCIMGSVPDAFRTEEISRRYTTIEAAAADIPCYIRVAIPQEQAAVVEPLDAEKMKVTVKNPTAWVENDLQKSLYEQFNGICSTMLDVWSGLQEDAND